MSEIKYSIFMPYHKRAGQLHNTFISFLHYYVDRRDYEIILIEDVKSFLDVEEHTKLLSLLSLFEAQLNIVLVQGGAENEWNPARLYNSAAQRAKGEYFIITSPECFHETNILEQLDVIFMQTSSAYIVCACEARKECTLWIEDATKLGGSFYMWYQHSVHRNMKYHFCSVLSRANWDVVGGFDEDYSLGIAYEDDAFRDAVQEAGIPFIVRDDLKVIHIDHDKFPRPSNYKQLIQRNKELYTNKKDKKGIKLMPESKEVIPSSTTIACVLKSGGAYTKEYVLKLRRALQRNTTVPFKFVCFTDHAEIEDCSVIPLKDNLPGWWSKIELFRPELFDTEHVLYFDLDTVILNNIDALFLSEYDFCALRPWNVRNRRKRRCASGMLGWTNNKYSFIYDEFKNNGKITEKGGDQAFISKCLTRGGIRPRFFQKTFSGIYSYKRNCRDQELPEDAKIVCFHGKPRLCDVEEKWVQENWI